MFVQKWDGGDPPTAGMVKISSIMGKNLKLYSKAPKAKTPKQNQFESVLWVGYSWLVCFARMHMLYSRED